MMPVTRETTTDEHLNAIVKNGRYNYRPKRRMPLGLRLMFLFTIAAWSFLTVAL